MICLLAGALTLFITSCSSTKNVQSAPDTYEDTPAIAEESSDGLEEDNGSEIKVNLILNLLVQKRKRMLLQNSLHSVTKMTMRNITIFQFMKKILPV